MIDNRNNFQFAQDVCAKPSGKLTCLKPRGNSNHGCSPLNNILSWCCSCHFFFFVGTKIIIPYSFFVFKAVGRVDIVHHFETFTVATTTWLTVMQYMCYKWLRICSTCRKHFPGLSSFMTYLSILVKQFRL